MLARRRLLGLLAVAVATALLSGCGRSASSGDGGGEGPHPSGSVLTVYSSLPLAGAEESAARTAMNDSYGVAEAEAVREHTAAATRARAEAILAGERLALKAAGGRVGARRVRLVSLTDASSSGEWAPALVASNAKLAARDPQAVAYVGDLSSGASAVSLPLTNAAQMLQVSPLSPYVGLTSSFDAGQGDPERFYPSGKRTFVRLMPGDLLEGAAEAQLLQSLHVRRLYVASEGEPFVAPLASIVAGDVRRAGISIAGEAVIEVGNATAETSFEAQAEAVLESGAEAIFFSGEPSAGTEALWEALHDADPALYLLGSEELAEPTFAAAIGGAGKMTYLATPVLPRASYPRSAQEVLAKERRELGRRQGRGHRSIEGRRVAMRESQYLLCGYEAMSLVLAAIRNAGDRGDDRAAVAEAALSLRRRDSVLGSYSVLPNGETTLGSYGIDAIDGSRLRFWSTEHPALSSAPRRARRAGSGGETRIRARAPSPAAPAARS